MNQELPEKILIARLKCQIIKDLFTQIIKNTKPTRAFYMNLNQSGIKMVFMESDKEVEIFIQLKKQIFVSYDLNSNDPFICKYDIKELELISLLFQNAKSTLTIQFQQNYVVFEQISDAHTWTRYRVDALEINEKIPQEVNRQDRQMQDENHTKIIQHKLKRLSNVLHTFGLQKFENIQIQFNSAESKLQIVPIQGMVSNQAIKDSKQKYSLRVQYVQTQRLDHIRFNLKKLKTCLSLFQKKQGIQLNFFENKVRIQAVKDESKDITINLACLA